MTFYLDEKKIQVETRLLEITDRVSRLRYGLTRFLATLSLRNGGKTQEYEGPAGTAGP